MIMDTHQVDFLVFTQTILVAMVILAVYVLCEINSKLKK